MPVTRDQLVYAAVLAARLVLPLLIERYPLPSILGCLVIDALDQTIFQAFTYRDLAGYLVYDKALDVYYLTLASLSTIRNWGGGPDFAVGRWLWYYRLIGVAIFEYTSAEWILLVFPNTFEYGRAIRGVPPAVLRIDDPRTPHLSGLGTI